LARRDVGTPVFGGMILASFIGGSASAVVGTSGNIGERLGPITAKLLRRFHSDNASDKFLNVRDGKVDGELHDAFAAFPLRPPLPIRIIRYPLKCLANIESVARSLSK
jgi:hypothetical protein